MSRRRAFVDKDTALQTLELTNTWISNADTKISFALAFVGVLIGFVFSSGAPNTYKTIFALAKISDVTVWQAITVIFLTALYVTSFLCVLELLLGITAKTNNSGSSLFFFGTISKKSVSCYTKEFLTSGKVAILRDLSEQIHTNSNICAKKFQHYNKGIKLLGISTVLWFIVSISQAM